MDNFKNSFPIDPADKTAPPAKKNLSVLNVGQILLLVFLFTVICLQSINLIFAPDHNIIAEPAENLLIPEHVPEISDYLEAAEIIPAEPEIIFILGENNGRLAILSPDRQTVYETYSVYINTLPELDRNLLREGIKIKTTEELASLLEDYSS